MDYPSTGNMANPCLRTFHRTNCHMIAIPHVTLGKPVCNHWRLEIDFVYMRKYFLTALINTEFFRYATKITCTLVMFPLYKQDADHLGKPLLSLKSVSCQYSTVVLTAFVAMCSQ